MAALGACTSNDEPAARSAAGIAGTTGGSASGDEDAGRTTAGSSSAGNGSGGATSSAAGEASGGRGGAGGTTGGSAGTGGESGEPGTGGNTAGTGGASGGSAGTNATGGTGGMAGAPADEPIKVVIIGSSTPAGKNLDNAAYGGTTLADSWPNRYAAFLTTERPGSVVVNLAISGSGTWEGLPNGSTNSVAAPAPDTAHNITAALAESPDAIIVNFPSGDVVDGWTVDQVITNLLAIEAEATGGGVPIWIATSQPAGGITAQQITMLEDQRDRTLSEFGENAIDFWTPLAESDGTQKPELSLTDAAIHPNAEGHRLLFEAVKAKDIPGSL